MFFAYKTKTFNSSNLFIVENKLQNLDKNILKLFIQIFLSIDLSTHTMSNGDVSSPLIIM